jgi:hypothetical protein
LTSVTARLLTLLMITVAVGLTAAMSAKEATYVTHESTLLLLRLLSRIALLLGLTWLLSSSHQATCQRTSHASQAGVGRAMTALLPATEKLSCKTNQGIRLLPTGVPSLRVK